MDSRYSARPGSNKCTLWTKEPCQEEEEAWQGAEKRSGKGAECQKEECQAEECQKEVLQTEQCQEEREWECKTIERKIHLRTLGVARKMASAKRPMFDPMSSTV